MVNQTYHVTNISCAHCTHTIERELKMVRGVQSVAANLQTKDVAVVVDAPPALTSVEQMLVEIGYPGERR
ncbi:MAG: heavy-metal-associated domain-containing protein [Chloroflexi bacterium]|nr:heavy-metal-associated domain-containing protein [Chloroflexota bacterium]MBI3734842.1 heavy-metal-associated domain-containing protein [Chloroflexota bacterium]